MPKLKLEKQKAVLRDRIGRFFANKARERLRLLEALNTLKGFAGPAFLFGGVLRDLMLYGPSLAPRDVDVVVSTIDLKDVTAVFSENLTHTNRFGGLHLRIEGWHFDIWPLSRTWAFCEKFVVPITFESLPKTTFLNIEAVAARLDVENGQYREIFSHGFFESISSRTIEINSEPNPYPALCVLRSLMMAARLEFAIGPKLADYILTYSKELGLEALMQTQWEHYGRVVYQRHHLKLWLAAVAKQLATSNRRRVKLPTHNRQLAFFYDGDVPTHLPLRAPRKRKLRGLAWR